MTRSSRSRFAILITVALFTVLILATIKPGPAYAASSGPLWPLQSIPGWLQEALDSLETALVKTLQDTSRVGGVMLWGVLKVCGMVGLFGNDFSALFGTVVTEALNAVVTGSVHDLIRGSLMVSLGILGLSLLARPFWPDLRLVSFQRVVIWGIAIQAYLVSAPTIYTELETWRVDLAEEVAGAVSSGAIPGCSGNVVEVLLCITGTSTAEVLDPDLSNLPDQIPYGGSESVRDLYDHCVYNPPVLYGDPACDPDNLVGDPWEVLDYAQDALGTQLLGLILAFLILAYGVLQISLGLAAGMMFVLFPVAAIFAFYLPLESFPAGVIRNYISIFLKSVVLLTLAGVVIRLFSISTGSLAAMAAVGLIDLLLCFIMAKEALASLLGAVSFVGSSVSTIGANFGLAGGGGTGAPLPTPESRTAATMITKSSTLQSLMGEPRPFDGTGATVLGTAGSALSSPLSAGRAAAKAAVGASTGAAGFVAGAAAAARGADYGSLALTGSAITSTFGDDAGRGFVTGAGAAAMRQVVQGRRGRRSASGKEGPTTQQGSPPSGTDGPTFLVPPTRPAAPAPTTQPSSGGARIAPGSPATGAPPATAPLQTALQGRTADLSRWTPDSAQRLQGAAAKLGPAPAEVQQSALELIEAGHQTAQTWAAEGRSPVLDDGTLDPQLVEEAIELAPAAAQTFVTGQAEHGMPIEQRLALGEAVALGVTTEQTVAGQEARRGSTQATVHEIPRVGTGLQTPVSQRTDAQQSPIPVPDVSAVAADMPDQASPAPESLAEMSSVQAPDVPVTTAGAQAQTAPPPTASTTQSGESSEPLQRQLRSWRAETAAQSGQKAFQVLPNATLERIADARPQTMEELRAIRGVGPKKLERYGSAVLDITRSASQQPATSPSPAAESVSMPSPPQTEASPRAASPAAGGEGYDPTLFEHLRDWRLMAAQERDQKAFHVFSDATLQRIAAARPTTMGELQAVKGVGPKKLEQYGQAVLGIIQRYPAQTGGES